MLDPDSVGVNLFGNTSASTLWMRARPIRFTSLAAHPISKEQHRCSPAYSYTS